MLVDLNITKTSKTKSYLDDIASVLGRYLVENVIQSMVFVNFY